MFLRVSEFRVVASFIVGVNYKVQILVALNNFLRGLIAPWKLGINNSLFNHGRVVGHQSFEFGGLFSFVIDFFFNLWTKFYMLNFILGISAWVHWTQYHDPLVEGISGFRIRILSLHSLNYRLTNLIRWCGSLVTIVRAQIILRIVFLLRWA